jgi:hypothetical protein
MNEPTKSEHFWNHGEGDPIKTANAIAEKERRRSVQQIEEHRAEQREVLACLQGQTGNSVPPRCKRPAGCPLNFEAGHGEALPSVCFWTCGIETR